MGLGPGMADITVTVKEDACKTNIHLLPCSVQCEGENEGRVLAHVEEYFVPTIQIENDREDEGAVCHASFRGRPLAGREVKVSNGFSGVILQESGVSADCSEGREFAVKAHFSQLHYWNLQTLPTSDDKLLQALSWTRVADSLHARIPVKDESSST